MPGSVRRSCKTVIMVARNDSGVGLSAEEPQGNNALYLDVWTGGTYGQVTPAGYVCLHEQPEDLRPGPRVGAKAT